MFKQLKEKIDKKVYYSKYFSRIREHCFKEAYNQACIDGQTDDYMIKRCFKALEIACEVIKSDEVKYSDEYNFLISYIISNELPEYFLKKADEAMREEGVIDAS